MKLIWMSAIALGLAACSAPAEKPREKQKAAKGFQDEAVADYMKATGAKHGKSERVIKKNKAMPASKIAGVSATALAKAIETALQKVPGGEALAAEIEIENGKAMIDVKVFAHGKLYEVEIDAATGIVQEVDDEDDDDDDDDDDEDDEDGDDD